MVLSPDDLLIFKGREGQEEERKKVKKKPQPQAPPQPPVVKAPPQKPVIKQKPPEKPIPQLEVTPQEIERVEKMVEEPMPGAFTPSPEEEVAQSVGITMGESGVAKRQKLTRRDAKKLAEHMACENHPWRRGYAICNYCRRAFCYEDIVEHDGTYYCLDDLDKVPQEIRTAERIKYTNLSFVSAVLMMMVFVIFVYYSYSNLQFMASGFAKQPTVGYLGSLPLSSIVSLVELALAVLSFVAAILVLMGTRISFGISQVVGLCIVGLFSYEFLNTQLVWVAAVAALSFIAMVALAYSRVAYEAIEEEEGSEVLDTVTPKSHTEM